MAFVEEIVLDGETVIQFCDDFIVAKEQVSEILKDITQSASVSLRSQEKAGREAGYM